MSEEIKNLEGVLTFNGRPIMTPSRAKEVLEGMGLDTFNKAHLQACHMVIKAGGRALLSSTYTLDELEAIALWMQDPEGVTNA